MVALLPCPFPVYGWGDQPSTRWFLEQIADRVAPGMRVADVGGGTGILGLDAAERGATVVIYESDPRWRDLIERNVAHNDLSARVTVRGAFPDEWDGLRYDLIVANIGDPALDIGWENYTEKVLLYEGTP